MKKLSCLIILTLLVTLFIGCSNKVEKENQIIIWAKCNEKEEESLRTLCDNWAKDNGQKVKLISSTVNEVEYNAAKESKYDSPDIIWGISSEKTEWLKENNAIEELPENTEIIDEYISNDIVENTSIDGKRYAIPISVETIALFYNKDLVSEVPEDMSELMKVAKDKGISFYINNGYFSYGFISACGGYVFKNENGTFNKDDIGLNNEGAIEGYKILSDMCNKYELISQDSTDDSAEACFSMGKTAFYIGEAKKIDNFIEGKVNFAVTTVPKINGESFKPFKEVKMAFVNPYSAEKDESYELLKYLRDNSGEILIDDGNKIPVLKKDIESDNFKNNEYLQGFYKQLETSEVTPNIYELEAYWSVIERNLQLLTLGDYSPEECGKKIVQEMKENMKEFN